MNFDVVVNYGKPSEQKQWDALSLACGNLVQHSSSTALNRLFNEEAVFIEVYQSKRLVAGYQFSYYESKRLVSFLRFISRSINCWGEYLIVPDLEASVVAALLDKTLLQFIKERRISRSSFINQYGLAYFPSFYTKPSATKFRIAVIDLELPVDSLTTKLHAKHKYSIRKAEAAGVTVQKSTDIALFISLLKETYSTQVEKQGPNTDYIQALYTTYLAEDFVSLYLAYKDGIAYSGALITHCGDIAYYSFAGLKKSEWFAGHLNQWFIIQDLKQRGFKQYVLGQVAAEMEQKNDNEKFVKGITPFKLRFGPSLRDGISSRLIHRPFSNFIWNCFVSLFSFINRK